MFRRVFALFVALFIAAPAYAQTKAGLVAHWDFNDGRGNVLHDKSGNNNDGEIHGAKWVKCGEDYALRFDRSGDYTSVTNVLVP